MSLLLGSPVGLGACHRAADRAEPPPSAPMCADSAPLRKLTRFEYDNTVRDLLGDDTHPAESFATEPMQSGFDNQASAQIVTALDAEQVLEAAEQIAARAVAKSEVRARLLGGCRPDRAALACGDAAIAWLGPRAFRRPLDESQQARLQHLFRQALGFWGFDGALRVLVTAVLSSPYFLYRPEADGTPVGDGSALALDDYEIASRLSYLLWGSMPDDALFARAAAGRLHQAADIAAAAKRMLDDPKAIAAVQNFHAEWLQLYRLDAAMRDPKLFPDFNQHIADLWREQVLRFVEYSVFEDKGDLATLLTSPVLFENGELAAFYRLSGVAGDGFTFFTGDPAKNAGLLTYPAVVGGLSRINRTSPVLRGKFVREQLLCETMPKPPPGVADVPPAPIAGETVRAQFEAIENTPSCGGCHLRMSEIGFGFEHYDPVGRWQDHDAGQPIDDRGQVVGNAIGRFDGPVELAERLAESQQVRDCVVLQWQRYAFGHDATSAADSCTNDALRSAFSASGGNIRQLLLAIVTSDAFRHREPIGGAP